MRAYISADDNLDGHTQVYKDNCNGPLPSQLGARFDRLREMQQQRVNECGDSNTDDINDEDDKSQDIEDKSVDSTGDANENDSTDDDEYYEALFSSTPSATSFLHLSAKNSIIHSHPNRNKRRRVNMPSYSSLALSTSILAQKEIEEAQKRIAELEQSYRCMTDNHGDDLESPSLLPKEEENVDDCGNQEQISDSCTIALNDGNLHVAGNGMSPSSVSLSVSRSVGQL